MMHAECVEALCAVVNRTLTYARAQVMDLTDEELLRSPEGIPTSAAWTVGHIVHCCHEITLMLGAERWLSHRWEILFGYGSHPGAIDLTGDSTRHALIAGLLEAGERLHAALVGMDDERFGEELAGYGAFTSSTDALLQIVCAHTAFHAGQLALLRRALGKEVAGVFV